MSIDRTRTWNVSEAREYGHRLDGEQETENPWETIADRHDCAQEMNKIIDGREREREGFAYRLAEQKERERNEEKDAKLSFK